MKIVSLLSISILFFIGCTNYPVNNIPPKTTFVKEEVKQKENDVSIEKTDHRYDARYQNFNYDRLGYSNNMGSYYGYYDRNGYFYDNMYYNYDNRYTYQDRYNRQGYFDMNMEHNRDYNRSNGWNQSHNPYQPNYTRVQHPREGMIRYGDVSYQNSNENVKNREQSR